SPALTFLHERTTIFEEALVEPVPGRRAELLKIWQLPLDHLVDEAVSHELGHSLCNDSDEARAERRGRALQRGEKPNCGDARQNPSERGIWAHFSPKQAFEGTSHSRVRPHAHNPSSVCFAQ